ncbi:MAG TPA: MoaD/ThiS family protein [Candidatus Acidoferrales bacterium]|nr:MoaD/ThiS family protein [Candidatus Acidoferrales bacterium]
MQVTVRPSQERREVAAATVEALLTQLGLHRDAHLVLRGNEILTADVRLKTDDVLDIIPVISGGSRP